jgi:transcriptional accessory protein Tex/SPT6
LANFYNKTKKPSKPITKESLDDQKSDSYQLIERFVKNRATKIFKDVESRVADKKSYSRSVHDALSDTISEHPNPSEAVRDAFAETLTNKVKGVTAGRRK